MKSLKITALLGAFALIAWGVYGIAVAQVITPGVQTTPTATVLPVIDPLNCGENKRLVRNNSNQPKTYYVEITDCCDGVDSVVYLNSIHNVLYYVPDGGSICLSVTLDPGDRLFLDCNGTGTGDCTVIFRNSCNAC